MKEHAFPHLTRWQALRWRALRPLLVRDGEPTVLAWLWIGATGGFRRDR